MTESVPCVTFLSDYGLADDFVGVCHGVIARLCPAARIIDLTHGIPAHDVRAGALILAASLPFVPAGVHLAVVDPGVGASRRAVALRTADGRLLVGPDNGLLAPAADDAGGVVAAVDIGRSRWALAPVSATFHGRDIFAPVAARLAAGGDLTRAGEPLDRDGLVRLALPEPRRDGDRLVVHVRYVDRFGNLQLDATAGRLHEIGGRLGGQVALTAGGTTEAVRYGRTFADVEPGRLLLYEDAQRRLAVAVNRGSAADRLAVGVDAELRIANDAELRIVPR